MSLEEVIAAADAEWYLSSSSAALGMTRFAFIEKRVREWLLADPQIERATEAFTKRLHAGPASNSTLARAALSAILESPDREE